MTRFHDSPAKQLVRGLVWGCLAATPGFYEKKVLVLAGLGGDLRCLVDGLYVRPANILSVDRDANAVELVKIKYPRVVHRYGDVFGHLGYTDIAYLDFCGPLLSALREQLQKAELPPVFCIGVLGARSATSYKDATNVAARVQDLIDVVGRAPSRVWSYQSQTARTRGVPMVHLLFDDSSDEIVFEHFGWEEALETLSEAKSRFLRRGFLPEQIAAVFNS